MVANGKELVRAQNRLEDVHNKYKDDDGFLYILYTEENVFG